MSISGAILILAIVVIRRFAIHRLPKKTFMVLWAVVLLRLLIPFTVTLPAPALSTETVVYIEAGVPSAVGAPFEAGAPYEAGMPSVMGIPSETGIQSELETPSETGIPSELEIPSTICTPPATENMPGTNFATFQTANIFEAVTSFNAMLPNIPENTAAHLPVTIAWSLGISAMALFFLITHLRSRREYNEALPVDNPYIRKWLSQEKGLRPIQARQSDKITAPLTYGIIRPVILFPKTTNWQDVERLRYIFVHEMTHIKRFDILAKWMLAIALCVHWFNPLVWVMYIVANRDMELSCDEAVVRAMGESSKSTYAMALVGLEERRSVFAPLCTSFSKNLIEERIVAIMKLRKRSVVSVILAAILVSALTIGALTVFASSAPEERPFDPYDIPCQSLYVEAVPATPVELYVEATLADEDDMPDEPGGWDEWLEWFNSLTPEEQSKVSLRPPYDKSTENENQAALQGPYRIATTIEEVRAIIALHDGTIPLTNIDVPEIRNRRADGIIILEQCLYEALDVLLQAYAQNGYPIRNMATTRVDMQPPFEELPDAQKVIMLAAEFFFAAIDMGLVDMPPGGRYHTDEEVDLHRNEARRLLDLYAWRFPSNESIRESAYRLFGGHEPLKSPYMIATTLEEVRAIIALQDGTIPITNVDVPEIRNGQANGIIITQQCLYEALAVLNEVYRRNRIHYGDDGGPVENMVTSHVQFSERLPDRADRPRMTIDLMSDVWQAAVDYGIVEPEYYDGVPTSEQLDILHEGVFRISSQYDYNNDNWPSGQRIREIAQYLFGGL